MTASERGLIGTWLDLRRDKAEDKVIEHLALAAVGYPEETLQRMTRLRPGRLRRALADLQAREVISYDKRPAAWSRGMPVRWYYIAADVPKVLPGRDLETIARRHAASLDPDRWRAGGSESTQGRTLYQGNRFVGLLLDPADVEEVAAAMNAHQFGDRQTRSKPDPTIGSDNAR